MLRPYPLLLLLFHVVLLLAWKASAAPTPFTRPDALVRRADGDLKGPVTVTTVRHTDTSLGTMTETCEITLTPQTQPNGKQVVQEVKKCKITMDAGGDQGDSGTQGGGDTQGGGGSQGGNSTQGGTTDSVAAGSSSASSAQSTAPAPPPSSTTTTQQSSPPTTTQAPAILTLSTSNPASTPSPSSSPASSTSPATSANPAVTGNPALSVNGVSSVSSVAPTGTPATTSTTSSSTPATTSTTSSTTSSGKGGASAAPASVSPSGSGSAASADQTSSAFAVGGKKLSVLPIGLGVFAGISVIALIVVGLVTYERTKYRKAFRQRKLAEAGATMGYGGMAERT